MSGNRVLTQEETRAVPAGAPHRPPGRRVVERREPGIADDVALDVVQARAEGVRAGQETLDRAQEGRRAHDAWPSGR